MIEVIYNMIDLIGSFINKLFNFQVDFVGGKNVPIGMIVVAFVFLIVAIYLIFKALGIIKESDN